MVGLHLHLLRIGNGMPLPSRLYASAGIPTHARSLLTAVAPEPRRKAGGKAQAGGRLSPLFSASRNRRRRGCGELWKTRGPGGWAFSKGCGKMAGRRRRTPAFRRPAASTALVGTPPRAFPKGLFTHRFCGRPENLVESMEKLCGNISPPGGTFSPAGGTFPLAGRAFSPAGGAQPLACPAVLR